MRAMPVALLCLTLGACASASAGPTPNLPPRCQGPHIEARAGYQVESSGDAAFTAALLLLSLLTRQAAPTCP